MEATDATSAVRERIVNRIPQGWGKYISCSEGWDWILTELDLKLSSICPDYEVLQVKEKFGTLRFYYNSNAEGKILNEIVEDIVNAATRESETTCEYCGKSRRRSSPADMNIAGVKIEYDKTVRLRDGGWIKILCNSCAKESGKYPTDEEIENEDGDE